MSNYSFALFLHIVGALGFFVALGLEWTGLSQLRIAMTLDQVRAWMGILKNVRKVGFASMLTTVITGISLMVIGWGGVMWIYVTLGSLVLVIVLSAALSNPRMAMIGQALVPEGRPMLQNFHNLANHPILWISIQTRMGIALGIVFLKIVKPDLGGSLLTIGVAIVLSVASALPVARREQAREASAD